jgi:hypothetical protein
LSGNGDISYSLLLKVIIKDVAAVLLLRLRGIEAAADEALEKGFWKGKDKD